MLLLRVLRGRDLHKLHLLELVLPNEAAGVAAVAPGLGAEAGREGAHGHGQLALLQDGVGVEVREGHLRRGDQEPVLPVHLMGHLCTGQRCGGGGASCPP